MKIKNKEIIHVIKFLESLNVKGMKSIHRTRIANKLIDKSESFFEAQQQLKKEYDNPDEEYQIEFRKLIDSYVTIDDTDSKVEKESLKSIIKPLISDDSEYEFEGSNAIAIAVLYEALELGK